MKRNMLFLTVVIAVLVALMVPSFAMAEAAAATPTLTIGEKTAVKEKLTGDLWSIDSEKSGIAWTATGFTTDAKIEWSSSNNSVIWFLEDEATTYFGKDDAQVTHPTMQMGPHEDCVDETATVTGKVSVYDENYGRYKPLTTISFPVTLEFVPAAKITGFEKTSYEFYATTAQDFNDQVKTAEPAEGAEVVRGTFDGQYYWKVDNSEYAEVDEYGTVVIKKLPADKAVSVKLTVWAKGDESNTASTTLEIQPEMPKDEDEESVEQSGAYTYLAFRADTFTFSEDDGDVWLNDRAYLDWKGNQGGQDNLIWSSSDIAVATVYNGDFEEHFYNSNGGRLVVKKASTEPITITVRSKMNPAVKATCKVVIKAKDADKEEAKKAYTSMEFAEESLTVYKGDESIDLRNYLIVAPYGCGDEIIWTCDDSQVGGLWDGCHVYPNDVGEVTVTAKSRNGDKQASIKITVIEGEGVEKKPYEEVTTALSALTLYEGDDYYLGQFVDAKPMNGDDSLVWVSSDKDIVEVAYQYEDWGDGHIFAHNAGEATITAKSKLGDKKAEIKVTVKKASEKKVPFTDVHFAVDSLTMYIYEGEQLSDRYLVTAPDWAADRWNDSLIWSTSDREIVNVNQDGWAWTNDKTGEATITAKSRFGEKQAELKITVKKRPKVAYTAINVDKTAFTLYEGDDEWLMWQYVRPEPDSEDDHLMWTSSDETVAFVQHYDSEYGSEDGWIDEEGNWQPNSGYGRVIANKEGKATITVRSYLNPKLSKTIEVTVKAREEKTFDSISFTADKFEVKKSAWGFDPIGYIVFDPIREDVNLQDLVWTSSDEKVATVDEGGYVHFNDFSTEKETVTISVRAKNNPKKANKSFELTIVNDDVYFKSIEFTAEKYAVKFTDGSETHWEEDEDGEWHEVTNPETFDARQYLLTDPINNWEVSGNEGILWTSSDPQTAEVYDGVVYLHKLGTVTITARSEHNAKAKGSFELEIKDALTPIESIATTQDAFSLKTPDNGLYLGQYLDVKPVENDDDLVWTSSDPEVLNVARGFVELGLPGEATITVRSKMNSKVSATISVKVEEEKVEKLKFIKDTPTTLSEKKGTLRLTKYLTSEPWYYAVPDKGYTDKLVWTTSNPQIATVENGVVYYQAPGKVRITVSDEDGEVKASVKLTMTEVPVTKIVPSTKTLKLSVGEGFELVKNIKAIKPANASYGKYDIVWSSSNEHVAYISDGFDDEDEYEGDVVVANEVGTTKITALIRNKDGSTATATFKVKVSQTDIEKVKFAKSKYTFKTSDGTAKLKYTVTPADAKYSLDDLEIQSSHNCHAKVISYDKKNVWLQLNEPGKAVITIKSKADDKVLCKTKVIVEPVYVTGIRLMEKTVKMNYYRIDENHLYQNIHTIYPIIRPTNAYHITKWETSNASVAFVNQWGSLDSTTGEPASPSKDSSSSWSSYGKEYAQIVATGEGTATLTMTVEDGKNTFTWRVKVIVTTKQVDLKLNKKKAKITMLKGADNTLQLEAYDNETDEAVNVKWKSSNKAVATVDKNGLVTALKAGEAIITATTKDGNKVQATCKLTVEKLAVESVKGKAKLTMKVGGEKDLSVKVAPSNAYDTGLKFKSSKPGIVSVDANGHLVAKKAGKATITAKATDGSKKTLKIEVTVKEAE